MTTQAERIAALETEIAELRDKLGSLQALQRRTEEILRVMGVAELAGVPERLAGVEKQLDVFALTLALRLMQAGQPVPEGLVSRLLPGVEPLAPEPAGRTFTDERLLAQKASDGHDLRPPPGARHRPAMATPGARHELAGAREPGRPSTRTSQSRPP